MASKDSILVALIVVLAIVIASQCGAGGRLRDWWDRLRHREGFSGTTVTPGGPITRVHYPYHAGPNNPYTVLNKEIDEIRGARNDGYNQPPIWRQPHGLDRYHRSGAYIKPDRIAEAEREAWYAAAEAEADATGGYFDAEGATTPSAETFQGSAPRASMDYQGYITDLIVDPRTRENHSQWVEEMKPWSGTAMTVDNLDEAMEATTDFIGLRRPQMVAQFNPLQLTERDTYTFASNNKFNFRG
jgi:hypothetical protein